MNQNGRDGGVRPFDDPPRLAGQSRLRPDCLFLRKHLRGELRNALDSCPGAATLDGLKRRTRVLTGRCQGFNCCVPIAEMISQHYKIPLASVTKRGPGSEFIAAGGDGEHTPFRCNLCSQSGPIVITLALSSWEPGQPASGPQSALPSREYHPCC